jgi:hypothetical protein
MTTVFADTYYFLALVNANDPGHARAVAFTKGFKSRMTTTAWVLVEMADALAFSTIGRAEFLSTWNDLQADPDAEIIGSDDQLRADGIQLYSQRPDKEWSLTDCVSFVVMQRRGITDALTKDHHFEQAGFVALLK